MRLNNSYKIRSVRIAIISSGFCRPQTQPLRDPTTHTKPEPEHPIARNSRRRSNHDKKIPSSNKDHKMEKAAKPSRALSIIDVIIKLLAVGALWAIFAMLLQIRGNLDKMVNNSEGIRIRMLGNVGTSIPLNIRLQEQGGTFSTPWVIQVKQ